MTSDEPTIGDDTMGLGARAARGAAITLGAQLGKVLIQITSVVILARLLTPHDYGLLAMVVAVIGIGEIFRDFGLSSAAIQAPVLSAPQRDNLFWINTGIGATLAATVYFSAGLLALVYEQPELAPITQALSLTFLLNGLATQYRASLIRALRFRLLALADIVAPGVALGIAIAVAMTGWGYWALVAQQLSSALILLVIVVMTAGWVPGLPKRHVPLRGFLRFGWNLVASQLIGYLSNNVDSVLIGLRFGAAPLGLYDRGYRLLMTPLSQIRAPLTTVALPVLSRITADTRRFGEYVCRGQLALGYTVAGGLGVAVGASEPITAIFLGTGWAAVAPILRLFAVAGIFEILAFVGYWVYVSRGLTGDLFRYSLISAPIKVLCIVVGSAWGVIGVAIGFALAPALSWPISLWWLSRCTTLPIKRLYAGAGRIIAMAAVASAAAWLASAALHPGGPWVQLGGACLASLAVYALGSVLRPIRTDIATVIHIARMLPARRTVG